MPEPVREINKWVMRRQYCRVCNKTRPLQNNKEKRDENNAENELPFILLYSVACDWLNISPDVTARGQDEAVYRRYQSNE